MGKGQEWCSCDVIDREPGCCRGDVMDRALECVVVMSWREVLSNAGVMS